MDQNEVSGRLIVLETFVMTALGLYLSNSRNDPDYSKAAGILEHLRETSSLVASASGPAVRTAAQTYSEHLTSVLAENLRSMRGEGGQSH
jgi:hypothetical protein